MSNLTADLYQAIYIWTGEDWMNTNYACGKWDLVIFIVFLII